MNQLTTEELNIIISWAEYCKEIGDEWPEKEEELLDKLISEVEKR